MMRSLRHFFLAALLAVLGWTGAARGAITNQASVSYTDAQRTSATQQSNAVNALLSEAISYYTSSEYSTAARVGTPGEVLYVQASAPECNLHPDAIDSVKITIASKLTRDAKTYDASETGVNTGIFRLDETVLTTDFKFKSRDEDAASTIETTKNDTLLATIANCGRGIAAASLLIDPAGIVFDSATGLPLAGARVTLIDVTGAGNGGAPGQPAQVFAEDGVTAAPHAVVTDARGMYRFPLVAPSLYRLAVQPPSNYLFPSRVAPGNLAGERRLHLYGSYGAEFVVSAATGAVTLDVPLDQLAGLLYLDKSASRASAEVGDVIDYTVRVHNAADQPLEGVMVDDELPAGFSLVPGSVRQDGAGAADPAGGRGPRLRFAVGAVASGGVAELRYRVRIGGGALQGDGVNRASATSATPPLTSGVAAAKVKVTAGVFSEKAYIAGTVFADCDGDRLRGAAEAGIPGVRIWLEDGSYAITDADGRYSFADLRPRTHVAKLDRATLPAGASPALLDARNAGDAGSRFVDLHDGELAKADFALGACTPALREAIGARRAAALALQRPAATPSAAAPAAASTAAAQPAGVPDLAKLDNSLDFIGLADGAVMPRAVATVHVKGVQGARFTLLVNGDEVAAERVGKRSELAERQLASWEFVGVPLRPGRNELELRQLDQFGNPRGSRRIAVTAPGQLARIRLELERASVAADGNSLALLRLRLEDAHGVPVTERTAVSVDASLGAWQQADLDPREPGLQLFVEGGRAELALRAPREAGESLLKARAGAFDAAARIDFAPDLRPLVGAGVFDGAVSLRKLSGNLRRPARELDGFEDALRHLGAGSDASQAELGARAAMFVKGKVADDTLLTMAYDSDKAAERPLFRDLDPAAYYPTYGDDAQRGFDARSTGRLYLRADRAKSWLLAGDMTPPGATPVRNLGAYNRSLNGLRLHHEAGALALDAFASRDSTAQMVEEIAANGTSGPYLTGSGTMVINSERIEIVVYDRNRPGVLLSRRQMARYADYDIEALSGRILFRAPVPSLDADLNPVAIRITYEIELGGARFWTGGGALQYKLGDRAEVGGSWVGDRNPVAPLSLASVNASVRPDQNTNVTVEAARMDKAGIEGRAARIDATRKDGRLESHVYAGRADSGFDNPAASLPKGRAEAGARVVYRAGEQLTFGAELIHSADLLSGASRDGGQLSAGYAFGHGVRIEAGLRRAHENAAEGAVLTQPELTSVRAKLAAQVPGLPQAGVFVEAEQDVRDSGRRMLALGGDYRLAGGSRVYARHELISSLGSNYALNEGQQRNATVFGIDSDYMKDGRMFSEYRARGASGGFGAASRQAEAALGLRNLWNLAEGVRGSTSLERVKVLAGAAANESVALAAAIEYTRNPAWRGNARIEWRHGADSDSVLQTLGLAWKLSDTWSLLGKNTLAASRAHASGGSRVNDLLQTGVAYRALETLGWNGLAKYEYKLERDDGVADLARQVHAVSATANWQPTRETRFGARYAAKLARDRSLGLDTRSSAQLAAARVTRELGKGWDIGATAQVLREGGTGARQYGLGAEVGYQLRRNMWLAGGYNLLGFREPDLVDSGASARGVYLRLRMKFDERTLEGLLAPQASHSGSKE